MRTHNLPSLLDHWFTDFDQARFTAPVSRAFQPALDLIEFPDRYDVVADLPGVDQKAVTVEFTEGVLQIRGERPLDTTPEDGRTFRRERAAGRFARNVAFRDDVAVDSIEAAFRDGVLRVSVPKSEKTRPRQIPVSVH